jgi:hypothetical protein
MIIVVTANGVRLDALEDFGDFHVEVETGTVDVNEALGSAGFGRIDADSGDALIPMSAVRKAAEGRTGPDWEGEFDKMIAYARSKGWITEDMAIRAHIEAS